MKRKMERIILYSVCIWQIITGAITASLYLFNLDVSFSADPTMSMFGTFVFTYGMAYVTLGITNIILTKKFVEDNTVQKKLPIYWIVLAIIFLLLADYISLTFLILAIIITLAKNKPIILNQLSDSVEF